MWFAQHSNLVTEHFASKQQKRITNLRKRVIPPQLFVLSQYLLDVSYTIHQLLISLKRQHATDVDILCLFPTSKIQY